MTEPAGDTVLRVQGLVNGMLEKGYTSAAEVVLRAILASTTAPNSAVQVQLQLLKDEAARLTAAGQTLGPDNPVLKQVLAALEPIMAANAALINAISPELQASAVQIAGAAGAEISTGVSAITLGQIGVQWLVPNPEAVYNAIGFAQSDAFAASLVRYQEGVLEKVINQAVLGLVHGWNPLTTANQVIQMAEGLPTAWANTQMRTLQNTAYRYSIVANRIANADILEHQIRLSALKIGRTCMACLALHGQILPLNEVITDHHNGLCTSITKVRGLPAPQVTSGADFLAGLSKSEQEKWVTAVNGGASWRAMDAGKVDLRDFVGEREDDVYGPQVIPLGLKDILGLDEAQTFYSFNQ